MIDFLNEEEELMLEKNIVWIFGFPKNEVSLFSKKLASDQNYLMNEPLFAKNLGVLRLGVDRTITDTEFFDKNPDYLFSKRFQETWKFYLRKLILNRFHSQFPDLTKKIIINESEGESGSLIISKTLPYSKILFLLPDEKYAIDSFSKEILTDENKILISKLVKVDNNLAKEISTNRWLKIKNIINQVSESNKNRCLIVQNENFQKKSSEEMSKIYQFLNLEI